MEIDEKTIERIVRKVIKELQAGDFKVNYKPDPGETEELLRSYGIYSRSNNPDLLRLVGEIDAALETISDDPYYEIIPMCYFSGESREAMAEYFETSTTTISRQKKRLINILTKLLFRN